MKNQIFLNLTYISNFIPNVHVKNYSAMTKDKNKIQIKNLFIFILLLKHTYMYGNTVINTTLFVKPKKTKSIVVLRAPYRYKLARLNLAFSRHYIGVFITINNTKLKKNFFEYTYMGVKNQVKVLKTLSNTFDTNMLHQHKAKISFNCNFKKNFFLKNFIVIFDKYIFK